MGILGEFSIKAQPSVFDRNRCRRILSKFAFCSTAFDAEMSFSLTSYPNLAEREEIASSRLRHAISSKSIEVFRMWSYDSEVLTPPTSSSSLAGGSDGRCLVAKDFSFWSCALE
jgi:hypothetical protein